MFKIAVQVNEFPRIMYKAYTHIEEKMYLAYK